MAEAVLKMAAYQVIQKEKNANKRKQLSIKQQVLCDETAIIGVMKQKVKATGEVQEFNVEFGRTQSSFQSQQPQGPPL